ncbi:MAG TPA: efflux RND transporter periplasmic adaptor subunit [Gemmatimonadales bacterium]|nr:efflux RND transporter periplasmic adaptor subunit [Gemmatimonadales bacterium]
MSPTSFASRRGVASLALILSVLGTGVLLVAWKRHAGAGAAVAPAAEPVELVTVATAVPREHRATTTAIGTVLALQSITLRTELAGTVRHVALVSGAVVAPGTVLVALDVSVERAELAAARAQADLAATTLGRLERLRTHQATSQEEVDQARAQRDVAFARIAQIEAAIAKKTIRAPFRARVGIADVHPGQYLNEGTQLTTLQGVAETVHVDFEVSQAVAAALHEGARVAVATGDGEAPLEARVVAIDARVDPTTRNATVRARLAGGRTPPSPGSSVRVEVPVGGPVTALAVPVSALRKGPAGDHVWVVAADSTGTTRAHARTVRSGPVIGDTVLIVAGLEPGEQVAASGSFKLRESLKVEAQSASAAPAVAQQ